MEIFEVEEFEPGTKRALQRGEGIDAPQMIPSMAVPETPQGQFENPNTMLEPTDEGEVHEI